ncbi:unnamed protein product [Dicrocoelium dendriticum]|nr:unnamed protein product [Dicrocoelium dendriticum]
MFSLILQTCICVAAAAIDEHFFDRFPPREVSTPVTAPPKLEVETFGFRWTMPASIYNSTGFKGPNKVLLGMLEQTPLSTCIESTWGSPAMFFGDKAHGYIFMDFSLMKLLEANQPLFGTDGAARLRAILTPELKKLEEEEQLGFQITRKHTSPKASLIKYFAVKPCSPHQRLDILHIKFNYERGNTIWKYAPRTSCNYQLPNYSDDRSPKKTIQFREERCVPFRSFHIQAFVVEWMMPTPEYNSRTVGQAEDYITSLLESDALGKALESYSVMRSNSYQKYSTGSLLLQFSISRLREHNIPLKLDEISQRLEYVLKRTNHGSWAATPIVQIVSVQYISNTDLSNFAANEARTSTTPRATERSMPIPRQTDDLQKAFIIGWQMSSRHYNESTYGGVDTFVEELLKYVPSESTLVRELSTDHKDDGITTSGLLVVTLSLKKPPASEKPMDSKTIADHLQKMLTYELKHSEKGKQMEFQINCKCRPFTI